jgi:ATP-binding cassette subfamily C (CFTR/MRP) protein 1
VTLAPVVTFGIFSAKSQNEIGTALGSTRIFTTLSLLSLITQPLDLLFGYIPEILAAVACFSRIQNYLRQNSRPEAQKLKNLTARTSSSSSSSCNDEKTLVNGEAIKLRNASFGWTSEAGPVLSSIDLSIPSAKLTMIIGPIASGKSTLLKGILGETPISEGSIQIFSQSVAFCDQTPWLINDTLRTNITGSAHFDATWYAAVVRACALEEDVARFPEGDQVVVGSNGMSLSGGQKQRVVSITQLRRTCQ